MKGMPSSRRIKELAVLALLVAVTLPAAGQINSEKYAGLLLVGQFGEICTMCEAVVLCEASPTPPAHGQVPAAGSFTLYRLHTRSFLSQVSTIWEWFVANFSTAGLVAGHTRPVTIHVVEQGTWQPPVEAEMRVSLEPPRLAAGDDSEIDRRDRSWRRSSTGASIGYCERLPLWPALEAIAAHPAR